MKYLRPLIYIAVLMASIPLLIAYAMAFYWIGALIALGLGIFALFEQKYQRFPWYTDLFLVGIVILIILGAMLEFSMFLLLPATLGAIAAWDLIRFQKRLAVTSVFDHFTVIEKRHLKILALVLGSGGVFAVVVSRARIPMSFGFALVMGVILIISIGMIYQMLRN